MIPDPVTALTTILTMLGVGAWIPVILAIVGLFSVVAIWYPADWPGSKIIHTLALAIGQARSIPKS